MCLAVIHIESVRIAAWLCESHLQDNLIIVVRVIKHRKMRKKNGLFSDNQHSVNIGLIPVAGVVWTNVVMITMVSRPLIIAVNALVMYVVARHFSILLRIILRLLYS